MSIPPHHGVEITVIFPTYPHTCSYIISIHNKYPLYFPNLHFIPDQPHASCVLFHNYLVRSQKDE